MRTPRALATSYKQQRRLLRGWPGWVGAAAGVGLLVWLPFVLDSRLLLGYPLTNEQTLGVGLGQVNLALVAIMGAVALNLLLGHTGLISLGHAAFFAVGALVAAVAGVQNDLPFLAVLVLAGVVGTVIGLLVGLPSLRLEGLYLMLATLALHFIAMYGFLKYQLEYFGPVGIRFEDPTLLGWELGDEIRWYFFLLVSAVLVILGLRQLMRSRHGRSFIAVRDHEIAATSLGINVSAVRLRSFATSSFLVSVVGAAYAYYLGHVDQASFTLNFVIGYFAMVIIGGMGSMTGAVLGAVVWMLLPQVIQTVSLQVDPATPVVGTMLSTYQGQVVSIILGVLVILILRFKPGGLNAYWQQVKGAVQQWPYRP